MARDQFWHFPLTCFVAIKTLVLPCECVIVILEMYVVWGGRCIGASHDAKTGGPPPSWTPT